MSVRRLALVPLSLGLWLAAVTAGLAAPPQSDDWSTGKPQSFWTFEQVGDTGGVGETKVDKGQLWMNAGGADIWGTADGMSFLYQKVTGDFQVTVQVVSGLEEPADTYAKAGLMLRSSNDPGAAYLYLFQSPRRFGVGWEGRRNDGITSDFAENPNPGLPPMYLRLTRLDGVVTPYVSKDGKVFQRAGTPQNSGGFPGLKDEVLVGIAQSAHNTSPDLVCEATYGPFTALALRTDPNDKTAPAAVQDLAAAQSGPDSIDLSWTAPGGDAFVYDIRSSLVPITQDNWDRATPVPLPTPGAAGAKETVTATGLAPFNRYYFALRTTDVNINTSGLSNVAMAETPYAPPGPLREVYTNIGGGTSVDDLRSSAKYPDKPDIKEYLTAFEAPTNVMDNYGQRISGILTAPVTGDYTFGIAGDDGCELWLSTDETPAKAELIANVASWTNSREWTKEENQTSSPITLQQGKKYYIEALMKEGGGGDNLAVRWILPDGTEEAPIPASRVTAPGVAGDLGRLTGVVLDAAGKPVPSASVAVKAGSETFNLTADANGYYSVLVPPGSADLNVAFAIPFEDKTATGTAAIQAKQITSQNVTINFIAPPFFTDNKKRQWDDDFSGSSLDAKWTAIDIGDAVDGAQSLENGQLLVTAGGNDIWNQADGFHFIYQKVKGDFDATLQVVAIPDNRDWELGGLMIRANLEPGSPHAFAQVSPRHTIQDKLRPSQDSVSNDNPLADNRTIGSALLPNAWVKVRRQGTRVTYWWTDDPSKGYYLGSRREIPELTEEEVYVGIAATSHDANVVDSGFIFDNFRVYPLNDLEPVTPPPGGKLGDFDKNDKVNILDVLTALRAAAGITPLTAEQQAVADVNSDGKFNITDVVFILRMAAGLITEFPKA